MNSRQYLLSVLWILTGSLVGVANSWAGHVSVTTDPGAASNQRPSPQSITIDGDLTVNHLDEDDIINPVPELYLPLGYRDQYLVTNVFAYATLTRNGRAALGVSARTGAIGLSPSPTVAGGHARASYNDTVSVFIPHGDDPEHPGVDQYPRRVQAYRNEFPYLHSVFSLTGTVSVSGEPINALFGPVHENGSRGAWVAVPIELGLGQQPIEGGWGFFQTDTGGYPLSFPYSGVYSVGGIDNHSGGAGSADFSSAIAGTYDFYSPWVDNGNGLYAGISTYVDASEYTYWGTTESNISDTVELVAALFPDGSTPESHGYTLTFDSGIASPNLVPEPPTLLSFITAIAVVVARRIVGRRDKKGG